MKMTKNNYLGTKVGLGILAAVLGAYYFFGEEGEKHREKTLKWMDDAKRDLIKELKNMKDITQETYEKVSDKIIEKYRTFEKENPKEFALLVKELKGHWNRIKSHLKKEAKSAKSEVKKAIEESKE